MAQSKTKSGIQISYDYNKVEILRNNLNILIASIRSGNLVTGFHVSPRLFVLSSIINITGIHEDIITSLAFSAVFGRKIYTQGEI